MRHSLLVRFAAAAALAAGVARAAPPADMPAAIYADPAPDAAHPARMAVLHIPSGGVNINGVAYLAAGAGDHPTVVLFHGLPGNEKNLDLAQAIRRAGWNVVTFNYRGSWGSPGQFRFEQNLEDARSVLAYVRDVHNAGTLGVDARRIVIIGHSMGGWVVVNTAAEDHTLAGVVSISAGDMARAGAAPRGMRVRLMAENMEALAGVTAESMADDAAANATKHGFERAAPGLVDTPYLALTADDGLASDTDTLTAAIRARGGTKVTAIHMATDHSWSDHRVALEAAIITWLQGLN
jgi:pimeloyl-ACP methyl ester carboxylesterase